jgi:hypothetical protein
MHSSLFDNPEVLRRPAIGNSPIRAGSRCALGRLANIVTFAHTKSQYSTRLVP